MVYKVGTLYVLSYYLSHSASEIIEHLILSIDGTHILHAKRCNKNIILIYASVVTWCYCHSTYIRSLKEE